MLGAHSGPESTGPTGGELSGADLAGLAEAALVVSELFLSAPSEQLRLAFQDATALDEWPLTDAQSARGIAILRQALAEGSPDTHEALERDHLYLFTGIGKPLAQPYESPYLSKEGLLFDEQTSQVRRAYAAHGLEVPDHRFPDDHIGYEFAFVAHLARKAAQGADRDVLGDLQRFVEEHLGRFAPQVAASMREHADTAIYRGLADLSEGVLAHVRAAQL